MNTSCQWLQLLTTGIHILFHNIHKEYNMNTSCQWLQLLTTGIYILCYSTHYEYVLLPLCRDVTDYKRC